jgi:hypothetical protein
MAPVALPEDADEDADDDGSVPLEIEKGAYCSATALNLAAIGHVERPADEHHPVATDEIAAFAAGEERTALMLATLAWVGVLPRRTTNESVTPSDPAAAGACARRTARSGTDDPVALSVTLFAYTDVAGTPSRAANEAAARARNAVCDDRSLGRRVVPVGTRSIEKKRSTSGTGVTLDV